MCHRYVLDEKGRPAPEPDLMKWAMWFEKADLVVARNSIGDAVVSTVFLGLDFGLGSTPPILWETAVFGGAMNGEQTRCSGSREQAEAMHAAMVARVNEA